MDDTLQALERTCARLREGAVRAWVVSWRRLFHEPLLFKGCRQILDQPQHLALLARCHEHLHGISSLDYLANAPLDEVGLLNTAPGYALALLETARRLLATCYLAGLLRQGVQNEAVLLPWARRCIDLHPVGGESPAGQPGQLHGTGETPVRADRRDACTTNQSEAFRGTGVSPVNPGDTPAAVAQQLFARLLAVAPSRCSVAAGRAGVLRWLGRKPVARLRRVPILLFDERDGTGEVAWLSFELFDDGLGELFPAPRLLRYFDSTWLESFAQVQQRLHIPTNVDVQWELEGAGNRLIFEGRSVQAACHVGVSLLLDRQLYESDSVLSARVGPNGELLPVEGLIGPQGPGPKLLAARQAGCRRVLLSPADYHVLEASGQPLEGLELVEVENITAARQQVSDQVRLLQGYLRRLMQPPSLVGNTPGYLGRRSLEMLYIEPDVVPLGRALGTRGGTNSEPAANNDRESSLPYGDIEAGQEERRAWEEELASLERLPGARVVVLGPPGQGKSLLARMTAAQLAEAAHTAVTAQELSWDQTPLPLLVPLRALRATAGTAPSARALLQEALAATLAGPGEDPNRVTHLAALLATQAETPRAWLFLDALDEVRDADALQPFLSAAARWPCRIIITSRLDGYQPQRLPFPVREYRLANFLPGQSEEFMRRWFAAGDAFATAARLLGTMRSARQNPVSLARYLRDRCPRQVMQSPFLLTLLCAVVERHGLGGASAPPIDRVTLYEQTLELLLGDQTQVHLWRPLLQEIAWAMLQRDATRPGLPLEELLDLVQHSENRPPLPGLTHQNSSLRERAVAACEALQQPSRRLLVPLPDCITYVFPHRSFADFLAARYLAERIHRHGWQEPLLGGEERSPGKLISDRAWSPAWHELLLFLTGLLQEPRRLLRLLADPDRDDLYRHRLALAVRCLLSLRHPLPETNAILKEAFQLWQATLQAGTEAAAPTLAQALAATGWLNAEVADLFPLERLAERALGGDEIALATVRLLRGSAARSTFLNAVVPQLRPETPRELRLRALAILESLGSSAARGEIPRCVVQALADPDEEVRRLALAVVRSLRRSLLHAGFVELLLPLLNVNDPEVRRSAVQALGQLRGVRFPEDWQPRLAEALARLLSDPSPSVQQTAAEALWGLGAAVVSEPLLLRLDRLLEHEDRSVRLTAAWAGVGLGRTALRPALVRAWLNLLGDPDPAISQVVDRLRRRRGAARGLFGLDLTDPELARGGKTAGLEPALQDFQQQVLALLHHPEESLRRRAADVIGLLGAAATGEAFLGQLEQLLSHPDEPETRRAAAWALAELGPLAARPAVVAVLAERLDDPYVLVREAALQALERLGRPALTEGALMRLPALLQHRLPRLRHAALEVLGSLGPEALVRQPGFFPIVIQLLGDSSAPMVRSAAAQTLVALSPGPDWLPEALSALGLLLRDPDSVVRRQAADALGRLPAVTLPAHLRVNLLLLFEDSDAALRQVTARSAGRLASVAGDLLADLLERLQARDPRITQAAAESLALVPLEQLPAAAVTGLLRLLDAPQAGTVRGAAARTLGILMGQGLRVFAGVPYRLMDAGGRSRRERLKEARG